VGDLCGKRLDIASPRACWSPRTGSGLSGTPSKRLSWPSRSTSVRAFLARVAALQGWHGEVANNSPEPRHRACKPPGDLESLHREDSPYLAELKGATSLANSNKTLARQRRYSPR
jgi:hypothetical protein